MTRENKKFFLPLIYVRCKRCKGAKMSSNPAAVRLCGFWDSAPFTKTKRCKKAQSGLKSRFHAGFGSVPFLKTKRCNCEAALKCLSTPFQISEWCKVRAYEMGLLRPARVWALWRRDTQTLFPDLTRPSTFQRFKDLTHRALLAM